MRTKEAKYVIREDQLYKKVIDGTFLRCVDKPQHKKFLYSFYDEASSGHYSSSVTAFKILQHCYYWLGMFKDSYRWVPQ